MAEVLYLRKDDAESDRRAKVAIETLEAVIQSIKDGHCNGMVVTAFERMDAGPEVEMTAHRYYLSSGIGDMMTLIGLTKCVMDEMSEGTRVTMDMQ